MDTPTDSRPSPSGSEPGSPGARALLVGDQVRVVQALPYLKTADPMPMLRPPDLVDAGEIGQVVALRAMAQVAVRFRRGTFLLEAQQLELLPS
ncbi:MAG: hypothetical protein RLZZ589_1395 [Cyanobacteriota bacterium]